MNFLMSKKKKFKFEVDLTIEGVTKVSLTNGMFFAKIRLIDGKSIENDVTDKVKVSQHELSWDHNVKFPVKMTAIQDILKPSILRISVRIEEQGGKSYKKLGYVDIDLSQFTKSIHPIKKRILLQSYDAKKRIDNTLLCIKILLNLIEGNGSFECRKIDIINDANIDPNSKAEDAGSVSSGFGSLTKNTKINLNQDVVDTNKSKCHSRHSSQVDTLTSLQVSGYSTGHSRQSSSGADMVVGSSSTWPKNERTRDRAKVEKYVNETRPNPNKMIDGLLSLEKPLNGGNSS